MDRGGTSRYKGCFAPRKDVNAVSSDAQATALAGEPVPRLLARFAGPAILGVMADALNTIIDTVMIGQGIGAYALGAMAVVFPIHTVFLGMSLCIGLGAASIVSRAWGAGDGVRVRRAVGNALFAVIVVAVLAALTMLFALEPILKLFGADGLLIPLAGQYLGVYLGGFLLLSLATVANHLLRALGRPGLSMVVVLISTGVNIALDALFIFVFGWGMAGAAAATVIAGGCAALFAIGAGARVLGDKRFRLRDLRPDAAILGETLAIGSAVLLRLFTASAFNAVVNHVIMNFGGPLHLAVLNMVYRWMVFFSLPVYGVSQAVQPIVGFNYGAGNRERVREAVKGGLIACFFISLALYAVMMLFPAQLLALFNGREDLLRAGVPTMRVIILFFPVWGFIYLGISLFQALGRALPAVLLGVAQQVSGLILVLILPAHYGLSGVWLAYPLADFVAFIVVFAAVRHLARRERRLAMEMAGG
jgi:putative MATE family efflux protein